MGYIIKFGIGVFFLLLTSFSAKSQIYRDSISSSKFSYSSLILPGVLIGYGLVGIESDGLKFVNREVHEEVNEHIDEHVTLDNFIQYLPMVTTFGLDQTHLTAAHGYKDQAIILATSFILMSGTVTSIKYSTHIQRPDGSAYNSFPSGHTATAFMGAEFLRQEYKDRSPWPGIFGYAVAASTGMYRVYNDRHWITDVAAGAGVGILSTKVAYWIHPMVQKVFSRKRKKRHNVNYAFAPLIAGKQKGLGVSITF